MTYTLKEFQEYDKTKFAIANISNDTSSISSLLSIKGHYKDLEIRIRFGIYDN